MVVEVAGVPAMAGGLEAPHVPKLKRRDRWSITTRITAGAVAAVAFTLATVSVGVIITLDRMLAAGVSETLEQDLDGLAAQFEATGLSTAAIEQIDDDERLVRFEADTSTVNDANAALLPIPREDETLRVEVDDEPYLVRSEQLADGSVLVVARSFEEASEAVGATGLALSVGIPIALALIAVVIWSAARRAFAPVDRMRRQVDEIDESGLHRRVPDRGVGDELDRLAGTLNSMLDRLEQAQLTQRRFVSDASHELRSPIATLRQFADLAQSHPKATSPGELAEVVLEESERMQHLVEGLLLLARLDEHRGPGAILLVDVDDLALAEVRRLRGMGGAQVDATAIGPGRVHGNERLLARALRNLTENARRHARGHIAITVERVGGPVGGLVRVHVDDDGDGIAEVDRVRIFERFARLDDGRAREEGGSGLGLAIVDEVARAHAGSITVTTSARGGARFSLTLPASPPDS
jgi:signal transduction histidine kinase